MSRVLIAAGFLLIAVGLVVVGVLGHRAPGRWITFGDLLGGLWGRRATRVAILLAWWWVGWHFLRPN